MSTMNVSLPDPMKDWAEQQAKGGRYGNASGYVCYPIRRDQEGAAEIAAMQRLITEGMESRAADDSDFDAFQERMREEHARGRA